MSTASQPAEQHQEQSRPPIAFQCAKCFRIVGDSWSWVCSHRELNSISLSTVNKSVELSEILRTSSEGIDIGSTYTTLNCKGCNIELGKMYRTTPRFLDEIRDMYSISIDAVISYEFGTGEAPQQCNPSDIFSGNTETLMKQISMLQSLSVGLYDRLQLLEQQVYGTTTGDHQPDFSKAEEINGQSIPADDSISIVVDSNEKEPLRTSRRGRLSRFKRRGKPYSSRGK